MDKPNFRDQILLNVKCILVRHEVSLRECNFSCPIDFVTIYGHLEKDPEGEFNDKSVVALYLELKSVPHVKDVLFQLDNWAIDSILNSAVKIKTRQD